MSGPEILGLPVVRSYKLRMNRIEFPCKESPREYGDTRFKIWPTEKNYWLTYGLSGVEMTE